MAAPTMIEAIKILRERTGAGMMDCKKALEACELDINKACDWLREKGIAKAAKKAATRIAAEGLTIVKVNEAGDTAVILEINCETDFVAKGDAFKALVSDVADLLLKEQPKCINCAKELTKEIFTDAAVKIGEKIDFRRFEILHKAEGQSFGYYIHMGGKVSALVLLASDKADIAKDLSIHIAANKPIYLTKADIPAEDLARETAVQMEIVKNDPKLAGKPEAALAKIVEGKVNKTFVDSVLSEQPYLMDESLTVGKYLAQHGLSIISYVRYAVGEGIEKRQDNFVEEVMNQTK